MTRDPQDLRIENTLLRSYLWQTARALKDYHDAEHRQGEDGMLELTVPESLRERAGEALERAQRMLKDEGRGR